MARIRRCDVCGQANLAAEPFCQCGTSLAFVPETEEGDAHQQPTAAAPTTREAQRSSVHLLFAWGEVEVSDRLAIGRDPAFSALADRLAPLGTVSRRHAEVYLQGGSVWVRHLSKENPTYIGARALLAVGEIAELTSGCEVAFSRALIATVKIQ